MLRVVVHSESGWTTDISYWKIGPYSRANCSRRRSKHCVQPGQMFSLDEAEQADRRVSVPDNSVIFRALNFLQILTQLSYIIEQQQQGFSIFTCNYPSL